MLFVIIGLEYGSNEKNGASGGDAASGRSTGCGHINKLLFKARGLKTALEVLEMMKNERIRPNEYTKTKLMEKARTAEEREQAQAALRNFSF